MTQALFAHMNNKKKLKQNKTKKTKAGQALNTRLCKPDKNENQRRYGEHNDVRT
jgi:hypothetical protein